MGWETKGLQSTRDRLEIPMFRFDPSKTLYRDSTQYGPRPFVALLNPGGYLYKSKKFVSSTRRPLHFNLVDLWYIEVFGISKISSLNLSLLLYQSHGTPFPYDLD